MTRPVNVEFRRFSRRARRGKKGPPGGHILVNEKKIVKGKEKLAKKKVNEKGCLVRLFGKDRDVLSC